MVDFMEMEFPTQCYNIPMIPSVNKWKKVKSGKNFLFPKLDTFLYQPYDDEVSIPEIQDGYYYFYDRHSESTNPYDDSELFQRFSFNFTFAIYDQSSNQIYLIEYDT